MISSNEIAERSQSLLDKARMRGVGLRVLKDQIYREDPDNWFVPVQPSAEPKKLTEYLEVLADVEVTLLEEDDLNVFFDPIPADDQPNGQKKKPFRARTKMKR